MRTRVIRSLPCKDFKLPPLNTKPPYFVEIPLEENNAITGDSQNIPVVVEEALSVELASSLNLKSDREPVTLCLTSGEENKDNTRGKKARVVAVIEGQIFLNTSDLAEEAGLPMPPTVK